MIHEELTQQIISCAMAVHRSLGPGLLEAPYHAAMCLELHARGMQFDREPEFPVVYRGIKIGLYRPDLIVENAVVVGLKSAQRYDPVFAAQVLTYMRVTSLQVGLLVNFGRPTLMDGLKRFVL